MFNNFHPSFFAEFLSFFQRFQDRCFKLEKDEYIEILKKEGKE